MLSIRKNLTVSVMRTPTIPSVMRIERPPQASRRAWTTASPGRLRHERSGGRGGAGGAGGTSVVATK